MAYYNTQPGAHPQMQVPAGGNRNALNKPFDSHGEREWSYGLCDCFGDCGTCCLAWCCPCIQYSKNKSRLEHLESRGYPHPGGGESCTCNGCIYCCLLGIGWQWVVEMGVRSSIRARYRVNGSGCGDCCASFWCGPCELTQGSREIELEEASMGR